MNKTGKPEWEPLPPGQTDAEAARTSVTNDRAAHIQMCEEAWQSPRHTASTCKALMRWLPPGSATTPRCLSSWLTVPALSPPCQSEDSPASRHLICSLSHLLSCWSAVFTHTQMAHTFKFYLKCVDVLPACIVCTPCG